MTRSAIRGNWLGLALIACTCLPTSGYAAGAYLFYRKTLGQWEIYCSAENRNAKKTCRLSGPPAQMGTNTPQNVLVVQEASPDTYKVALEVRDLVMPDLPAFVRIDRYPVHEAPVARGTAVWSGEKALRIVSEMRAGKVVIFRVQTAPDGMPRDTRLSLKDFREALHAYRMAIREYGLLNGK